MSVRLWEVKSGSCIKVLNGIDMINTVAFNYDGKQIVSAGGTLKKDKTIRLWDTESGSNIGMRRVADEVYCVTFSHDGKQLASGSTSRGKGIMVWDLQSNKSKELRGVVGLHSHECQCVAFNHDDTRLISGCFSEKTVIMWDIKTGKCLLQLWLPFPISAIHLSADDKTLCVSSGDGVSLFKIEELQNHLIAKLLSHTNPVLSSQGIILENVTGLSAQNLRLLQQRGDVKRKQPITDTTDEPRKAEGRGEKPPVAATKGGVKSFAEEVDARASDSWAGRSGRKETPSRDREDNGDLDVPLSISRAATPDVSTIIKKNLERQTSPNFFAQQSSLSTENTAFIASSTLLPSLQPFNNQSTVSIPKGSAETSAKRGLFARLRGSLGSDKKDKSNKKDKSEKEGSLSKKH